MTDHKACMADIAEMKSDIKLILKILNGNGIPGIVAKVAFHDGFIKTFLTILTVCIGAVAMGILFKMGVPIK